MLIGTLALAFLAGVLSILSPCVLPLLPVVLGAAAAEHKMAPVFLIAIGLLIVTGLDKRVETVLVNASPQWQTDLTTRF
jgi:cytochrome c-type biogenesis protein